MEDEKQRGKEGGEIEEDMQLFSLLVCARGRWVWVWERTPVNLAFAQ